MIVAVLFVGLVLAGAAALVRVVIGPSLADRVVGLDVALLVLMSAVVLDAAATGDTALLDLVPVISVVGFTATVAASRFIEHERAGP